MTEESDPVGDEGLPGDEHSPGEETPAGEEGPAVDPALLFEAVVEAIREKNPRYTPEAFIFVREALDWVVHRLPTRRHVSGPELLDGVRRLALDRFGPMARTVLNHWGLVEGEDVGRIVFLLIEAGYLSKTEEDRIEDFAGVMRFDDAFEAEFRWP